MVNASAAQVDASSAQPARLPVLALNVAVFGSGLRLAVSRHVFLQQDAGAAAGGATPATDSEAPPDGDADQGDARCDHARVGSGAGNMGSLVRLRCRRRPDRGRAVRLQHAPTLRLRLLCCRGLQLRLRLLCCRGLQLRLRLLCCRGGWTLAHGLEIERVRSADVVSARSSDGGHPAVAPSG